MDPAATPVLFTTLLEGLESFHARVSGSEGSYRLALLASGQPTLVLDVSRSALSVVRELLVWLREAIVLLQARLISIDALLAIGEVTVVLLQELGAVTTTLPGIGSAAAEVTSSISGLGTIVDAFPDPALLPGPELVAELRAVLEQLVGNADDPAPAGSLGLLLEQIEDLAA